MAGRSVVAPSLRTNQIHHRRAQPADGSIGVTKTTPVLVKSNERFLGGVFGLRACSQQRSQSHHRLELVDIQDAERRVEVGVLARLVWHRRKASRNSQHA